MKHRFYILILSTLFLFFLLFISSEKISYSEESENLKQSERSIHYFHFFDKFLKLSLKLDNIKTEIVTLEREIQNAIENKNFHLVARGYYSLAEVYREKEKYDKAIFFNVQGLYIAETQRDEENLFYLLWQNGQINLDLEDQDTALERYRQALNKLRFNRRQVPIKNNSLLFKVKDEANVFLREYIELLLESNQPDRVVKVLAILKLSEFQDYFNDPCFDFKITSNGKKNNDNNVTIYNFITEQGVFFIVESKNQYTLKFIDIKKTELENKINQYTRQEIVRSRGNNFKTTSKQLYNIFIKPLESQLPTNLEVLKVSNDGILKNLPWETLMDESERYLIQKYPIVSVSGLPPTSEEQESNKKAIFALTESQQSKALIYAKLEAERIAKISPTKIYLGKEFTIANLKNALNTKKISRIHLATHGAFLGTAQKSYLETFKEKISIDDFSKILSSREKPIYLLVMSGCETAIGNSSAPLGFSGVASRANIPFVLGTLWVIPDNPPLVEFMEDFYQALKNGSSVVQAKQIAQIKSIEAGENPNFWGSISLIQNKD